MHQDFFTAIAHGELAAVERMLAADPRLAGRRNEQGLSPLLMATYHRKPEIAAAILSSGIELDLFEAAATGRTERVRALLRADGSRVDDFSADGFFPLALAVFFGHADTVEALLAAGADVNQVSRESMKVAPIQSAAAARRAGIARILAAHGADVNAMHAGSGLTPLHEAAHHGDLDTVRALADCGADLGARTADGRTALAIARAGRHAEVVEELERRGATD